MTRPAHGSLPPTGRVLAVAVLCLTAGKPPPSAATWAIWPPVAPTSSMLPARCSASLAAGCAPTPMAACPTAAVSGFA